MWRRRGGTTHHIIVSLYPPTCDVTRPHTCTCMYPLRRFAATRPSGAVNSALRASFSTLHAQYCTPRSFAPKTTRNQFSFIFYRRLTHLERTKNHVRSDPYRMQGCATCHPKTLLVLVNAKVYCLHCFSPTTPKFSHHLRVISTH